MELTDLTDDQQDTGKILLLRVVLKAIEFYKEYQKNPRSDCNPLDTFDHQGALYFTKNINSEAPEHSYGYITGWDRTGEFDGNPASIFSSPLIDSPDIFIIVFNILCILELRKEERIFSTNFHDEVITAPICFKHFQMVAPKLQAGQYLLTTPFKNDSGKLDLKLKCLSYSLEEKIAQTTPTETRQLKLELANENRRMKLKGYPYEDTFSEYVRFLKNHIKIMKIHTWGKKTQIPLEWIIDLFIPD